MSQQVAFNLRGVSTEQFATLDDNYTEGVTVEFGLDLGFATDNNHKMVASFVKCAFSQEGKRFLILEVACHFEIDDKSWHQFHDPATGKTTLPVGIARHFAMITIGTTRGVLHAKTEQTLYNQFLLPTINLEEIIQDDPVIESRT